MEFTEHELKRFISAEFSSYSEDFTLKVGQTAKVFTEYDTRKAAWIIGVVKTLHRYPEIFNCILKEQDDINKVEEVTLSWVTSLLKQNFNHFNESSYSIQLGESVISIEDTFLAALQDFTSRLISRSSDYFRTCNKVAYLFIIQIAKEKLNSNKEK